MTSAMRHGEVFLEATHSDNAMMEVVRGRFHQEGILFHDLEDQHETDAGQRRPDEAAAFFYIYTIDDAGELNETARDIARHLYVPDVPIILMKDDDTSGNVKGLKKRILKDFDSGLESRLYFADNFDDALRKLREVLGR